MKRVKTIKTTEKGRKESPRPSKEKAVIGEIPAVPGKRTLNVECHTCGDTTKIPIAMFYDGFEGIFSCGSCQEPLDHLMDSLDE
jgi:hypothetical protein